MLKLIEGSLELGALWTHSFVNTDLRKISDVQAHTL